MRRAAPPSTPWRRLLSEPPRRSWIRDSKAAPWLAVGAAITLALVALASCALASLRDEPRLGSR